MERLSGSASALELHALLAYLSASFVGGGVWAKMVGLDPHRLMHITGRTGALLSAGKGTASCFTFAPTSQRDPLLARFPPISKAPRVPRMRAVIVFGRV